MSNDNLSDIFNCLKGIDWRNVAENFQQMNNYSYIPPIDGATKEMIKLNKQFESVNKEANAKRKEQESREKRNLEINEEKLELTKMTNFLLQSVNRDQKEILENIESLIQTIYANDTIKEANMAVIEKELLELKQSTDNLNKSFIKLIEKKLAEMGVEAAIKYLFIGIKELFIKP